MADTSPVDEGRARPAAAHVRATLARMYGRDGVATARQWHVVPCVTAAGTLGVVDIAHGTAWDSGVPAGDAPDALGILPAPYAEANMAGRGDVRIDGRLVQRDGAAVDDDDQPIPPTFPAGWAQLALPTWRGYDGDGTSRVPLHEYRPDRWVRPTLAAAGLITCYGTPGTDPGDYLDRAYLGGIGHPHGVPPWVEGDARTVLHVVAAGAPHSELGVRLAGVGIPRGDTATELARMEPVVAALAERLADELADLAGRRQVSYGWDPTRIDRDALDRAVGEIIAGRVPGDAEQVAGRLHRGGADGWPAASLLRSYARGVDRMAAESPWEAAWALARPDTHRALAGRWDDLVAAAAAIGAAR